MVSKRFYLPAVAAFIILTIGAPNAALATTRIVDMSATTCDSTLLVNPCYRSISAALTAAANSDTIEIHPGTYTETIMLTKPLTITGTETARTILSGGGLGPIITVSGQIGVAIRKLSFTSATTGILVQSSSSVTITNNVFRVGTTGTGIDVESSSTAIIDNNTFYQNLNALSFASGTTVTILNNIFSNNTGTAVSTTITASSIHNNCYFSNNTNGQVTADNPTTDVTSDPLFVNAGQGDFHLKTLSSAIDTGDTSVGNDSIDSTTPDIGSYGGPNADTIPYPISNLSIVTYTPTSITVTWSANTCYQVTGYNVHYGTSSGSYTATSNAGTVIPFVITGLSAASAPTGAPVLADDIANQTLLLNWTTTGVSGATGYEVRYSDTVTPPLSPAIDAGNTSLYALTGLTNGTSYYVSVTPYKQAIYYIAVTAYYNNTPAFESAFSNEVSQAIGSKAYGTSSNIIHDYPEHIDPNPNLPNSGCFIATAVYGYYSAPEVQTLREFRDHYLLTNGPGRAFVEWYYRYGPIGAEFINMRPWLKPIAGIALLPAIGGAQFMLRSSFIAKMIVLICIGMVVLYFFHRKRVHSRSGVNP
jgi:parallel beta-helix repeat protein